MDLHVFPIPIPPPTSLSTRSHWVFPVHQVQALVSCIQPGLVICFTLDNIQEAIFKHDLQIYPLQNEVDQILAFTTSKCLKVHPIKEFLIKKNNPQVPHCPSFLDHPAAFIRNRRVCSMVTVLWTKLILAQS